jgi:hypothetical protein
VLSVGWPPSDMHRRLHEGFGAFKPAKAAQDARGHAAMWRLMAAYRQLASDNSSAPHANTPKAAGGAPGSRQPRLNAAIFQGFASLVWQPQSLQTVHHDY